MRNGQFLKQELLARGWTPGLINRFLGAPDETPHRYGGGHYCVYLGDRVKEAETKHEWQEAVKQCRNRKEAPPQTIDLLAAIFGVTRAAKRYRDAAQTCYQKRKHGFAGTFRSRKEELYGLKDKGIVAALAAGRIRPVRLNGGLIEYSGEGYCFHSTLLPPQADMLPSVDSSGPTAVLLPGLPQSEPLRVEAKPRQSNEPRLKDAVFTLEALPVVSKEFKRLALPSMKHERQKSRYRCNDHYGDQDQDDGNYDNDEL